MTCIINEPHPLPKKLRLCCAAAANSYVFLGI